MKAARSQGGRVAAVGAAAVVALMTAGVVLAEGGRLRMTSPTGGWSNDATTTSTAYDVTIAKSGAGSTAVLTLGNSATNHGGTLKIYANPAAINAIEFRNPADATLRGYIYPSSAVVGAVFGPALFENVANKGTKTLAAGTGTQTVLTGSQCVCTDTTANASVKCVVSGTTLTFTGTGTDVIAYLCF